MQRQEIMETFEVRHLPVLRGETDIPAKYLPDPDCWTLDSDDDIPKSRQDKPKKKYKTPSHCKHVQRKLMWDFETETWVPNEMGSQAPPVALPVKVNKTKKRRKKRQRPPSPSPSSVEGSETEDESCSSLESFHGTLESSSPRSKKKR